MCEILKTWTCPACGDVVPITANGIYHKKAGHTIYRSVEGLNGYSPHRVKEKQGQIEMF